MNSLPHFHDYKSCYMYYVQKIMDIKQAKKYGEVIVAKPVLLLALIDGIEEGVFDHNRFTLNDWLEQRYETLMRHYSRNSVFEKLTAINLPFWHLQNDGFWHLHYYAEELCDKYTPTTNGLKKSVEYASFDDDLWNLLKNNEIRKQMRSYLIQEKLSTTQINHKETTVKATVAKPIAAKSTPAIVAKKNKTGSRYKDRKRAVMEVMRKLTEPKSVLDIAFLVRRAEWGGVVVSDDVEEILNNLPHVGKKPNGKYYLKINDSFIEKEIQKQLERKRKRDKLRASKRNQRPSTTYSQDDDSIVLTRELIESARTINGGFTKYQLAALGIGWPPPIDWIEQVIGERITKFQYQAFKKIIFKDPNKASLPSRTSNNTKANHQSVKPATAVVKRSINSRPSFSDRYEDRKRAVMDVMRNMTEPKSALDIAFLVSRVKWGGVVVYEELEAILNNLPHVKKTPEGKFYI